MRELRRNAFLMLEGVGRREGVGRLIDLFLAVLIVTNVAAVILETVAGLRILYVDFFGSNCFRSPSLRSNMWCGLGCAWRSVRTTKPRLG